MPAGRERSVEMDPAAGCVPVRNGSPGRVQVFPEAVVEPDHLGHAERGAVGALQGRLAELRIPLGFHGPADQQGAPAVDDPASAFTHHIGRRDVVDAEVASHPFRQLRHRAGHRIRRRRVSPLVLQKPRHAQPVRAVAREDRPVVADPDVDLVDVHEVEVVRSIGYPCVTSQRRTSRSPGLVRAHELDVHAMGAERGHDLRDRDSGVELGIRVRLFLGPPHPDRGVRLELRRHDEVPGHGPRLMHSISDHRRVGVTLVPRRGTAHVPEGIRRPLRCAALAYRSGDSGGT